MFIGFTTAVTLVSLTMIPTILYAQATHWLLMYTAQSNSMVPALRYNDKVIVDTSVPFESLKVGDIIAFKTFGTNQSDQYETIIHWIAQEVIDSHGDSILIISFSASPRILAAVTLSVNLNWNLRVNESNIWRYPATYTTRIFLAFCTVPNWFHFFRNLAKELGMTSMAEYCIYSMQATQESHYPDQEWN